MQTNTGQEPKKWVTGEFNNIMKRVEKKVRALQKSRPNSFKGGVRYVMDNALYHHQWMQQHSHKVYPTPSHSYEFNKVVEHLNNAIKQEANREYFKLMAQQCQGDVPRYVTFEGALKIVEAAVKKMTRPESLLKDAKTMRDTFKAVIAAKGDSIAQKYK